MPDTDAEWEQRIRERAYFLWQAKGCPEERGIEFWDRARRLKPEPAPPTEGESALASARISIPPLDRQRRGAKRKRGESQGLPFRAGPSIPSTRRRSRCTTRGTSALVPPNARGPCSGRVLAAAQLRQRWARPRLIRTPMRRIFFPNTGRTPPATAGPRAARRRTRGRARRAGNARHP